MQTFFIETFIKPSFFNSLFWVYSPNDMLGLLFSTLFSLQGYFYLFFEAVFTEGPYALSQVILGGCIVVGYGLIFYSLTYMTFHFLQKKFSFWRVANVKRYSLWKNILLRLLPFGYIITGIRTVKSGATLREGISHEGWTTIGVCLVYSVLYTLYFEGYRVALWF